jgi:DNA adenine methylase
MAGPILKWAGGKRRILQHVTSRLPQRIGTYCEPFIGGGSVFFELEKEKRFGRAIIGDKNAELVNFYEVVRDDPDGLIAELARSDYANNEQTFKAIRALNPPGLTTVQRAARMKYLNACCFNGLYRTNKLGVFNTPFGKYDSPKILDGSGIREASKALAGVLTVYGDFKWVYKCAERGDAVYCDPPYFPTSSTSSFTSYTADGFTMDDQRRLGAMVTDLARRRVSVVASNSSDPWIRRVYAGHDVADIAGPRAIAADGDKRHSVVEIIITGRAA